MNTEEHKEDSVEETTETVETPEESTEEGNTEATPEAPETAQEDTAEDSIEVEVIDEEAPPRKAAENLEEQAQLLRLKAEYDNFRKRTAKEKVSLRDDVLRQTVNEFLPVYDNLSRALQQSCQDEAFHKGVKMTMTQLEMILEKLELEKISGVGELFNPKYHEALARVDDSRWGENTVTEVFVEGFLHKDKVIRFAQVKVAN